MPNWVKNALTIKGKNVQKIFDTIMVKSEGSSHNQYNLDFNKIIPMPESLHVSSSSTSETCLKLYLCKHPKLLLNLKGFNKYLSSLVMKASYAETLANIISYSEYKDEQAVLALGEKLYNNIIQYGYTDWYHWSIDNWGTKWNASESFVKRPSSKATSFTVWFDTAWSAPIPILEKLVTMFPEHSLECEWADEDLGCNCGHVEYDNYQATGGYLDNQSKEAYELAFKLWDIDKSLYKFNEETGTYEWVEPEEVTE